ncbi:hypothetical protein H2199_008327 [Coniosporium tulheliwenetii]|uniref:Uncharacterized protein n=1 Tax=Coniosporium tulheliwenetii TaxID=3383036 RepID=A0ACC2YKZ8_9PEZI|nr:hypothetical protein H2199_008327 [Cladosporium sp. JES 115]
MSAFRSIRPSSSNTTPSAASEASSSSNPGGNDPSGNNPNAQRGKRRAPSHVSQNACTNCKKARAKCDGEEPAPCSRCAMRDIADQCQYEVHVKTVKEEMVRRIKTLEQQNADKDRFIQQIYDSLKGGADGTEAIQRLRDGQSYEQLADWLGRSPVENIRRLSPASETKLSDVVRKYERNVSDNGAPRDTSSSQWTSVVNEKLAHHLIALYFTWIHPVHMLFSEKHFMKSYSSGDRQYCTPSLVNVMCAMGAFLLEDQGGTLVDAKGLESVFLERLKEGIQKENPDSLPFVTTYAILFLVELSAGQARTASSHLRLAVESLHRVPRAEYDGEALELATWGVHTMNTSWAAFTYQKPSSPVSPTATVFDGVEMDASDAYWQPYRFPTDNASTPIPSYAIQTAKELAKLGQASHQIINVYCGSRGKVTASSIVSLYGHCLRWYEELPSVLKLDVPDAEALPHIFHLHIYYHVALCQLFQPLLAYDGFSDATRQHIRSIAIQSAQAGLQILERYQRIFSNRYQTPLQAFCLVHLCDTLIRQRVNAQEAIQFCLEMLHEALAGFLFIGPLQSMFCQTVKEYGLALPDNHEELRNGRMSYSTEELLDTCERITYVQPVGILVQRIDPSISEEFEKAWKKFIETHGGTEKELADIVDDADVDLRRSSQHSGQGSPTRRFMQIDSLMNP